MEKALWHKPEGYVLNISPARCLGDLANDIAEVESGMKTLPLVQYIQDWNDFPEKREAFLKGEIPHWCPQNHAAAIAAVVHALCDRDGHNLPRCLVGLKAEQDLTISLYPINSPFRRKLKHNSPAACFEHRVFFESQLLGK